MKEVKTNTTPDTIDVFNSLKELGSEYKLKKAGKKKIILKKEKLMILVQIKNNSIKIASSLNYKNKTIILFIIIGILLGVIAIVFVLAILHLSYNKKRLGLHSKVYEHLKLAHGTQ